MCPHSQSSASNDQLLSAALAGSPDALGQLSEALRTYLTVIGQRELRTDLRVKVSASDLVQETFVEAQRALASFSGRTPREFQAWLRGIMLHKLAVARRRYQGTHARDLAREERQAARSSLAAPEIVDNETPSQWAMRREQAAAVQQALGSLPEHYRQVIHLRNFELLPFSEIAIAMRRPDHELRALWVRAIKRLKSELDGLDL